MVVHTITDQRGGYMEQREQWETLKDKFYHLIRVARFGIQGPERD